MENVNGKKEDSSSDEDERPSKMRCVEIESELERLKMERVKMRIEPALPTHDAPWIIIPQKQKPKSIEAAVRASLYWVKPDVSCDGSHLS